MQPTQRFLHITLIVVTTTTLIVVLLSSFLDNKDRTVKSAFTIERYSQRNESSHSGREADKTDYSSGQIKYRIQFKYEGKCVGMSENNTLVVSYCNPNVKQAYVYDSTGILKFEETDLCVGLKFATDLGLVHCEQAIKLDLWNGTLIHSVNNSVLCVSPVHGKKVTSEPELGDTIALTSCDEKASDVQLLEERAFLKDRAALLLPYTSNSKCDFPACGTNYRAPKPKFLSPLKTKRCSEISDCVTVVVKTARRPLLVIRLAKSIQTTLNRNLSMIVIDDGPDLHPPEIMDKIAQFPNMKYMVGDREDLGISEGRNMGVRMVKTKYFMNLDDDYVVSDQTDIPKLLEMLDTMDVSLVGGKCRNIYAGFMEFGNDKETGKSALMYYPGSCTVKSEELSSYPGCYRCDLTANGFMARTRDILDVGGWSKELKIIEHKDIFLRLKAAKKKVVYCKNVQIQNEHTDKGVNLNDEIVNSYDKGAYRKLRHGRKAQMRQMFNNLWNIDELIEIDTKNKTRMF